MQSFAKHHQGFESFGHCLFVGYLLSHPSPKGLVSPYNAPMFESQSHYSVIPNALTVGIGPRRQTRGITVKK